MSGPSWPAHEHEISVDGGWCKAAVNEDIDVLNPVTDTVIGTIQVEAFLGRGGK